MWEDIMIFNIMIMKLIMIISNKLKIVMRTIIKEIIITMKQCQKKNWTVSKLTKLIDRNNKQWY